jgi:S-DNA-T family DNA segregation ATPase FtsK/SpoIIIE
MSRKSRTKNQSWASVMKVELIGLIVILLSVIGLLESGWLGKNILAFAFRLLAGSWDFLIPIMAIFISVHTMFKRKPLQLTPQLLGLALIVLAILTWDHLLFHRMITQGGTFTDTSVIRVTWDHIISQQSQNVRVEELGGGMLGALFFSISYGLLGGIGTGLLITVFFLAGFMFLFNFSYVDMLLLLKQKGVSFYTRTKSAVKETVALMAKEEKSTEISSAEESFSEGEGGIPDKREEAVSLADEEEMAPPVVRDFLERVREDQTHGEEKSPDSPAGKNSPRVRIKSAGADLDDTAFVLEQAEGGQEKPYQLPGLHMLSRPQANAVGREVDHAANAVKLVNTLKSFGVQATVTEVHRGPAVTRYEIQPATGVKVSRIVSLTDDLALALAAKDIRMEAPIPGKSAIGIEVPNTEVAVVTLREVLESSAYQEASGKLTVALGRDISGEPIVADLTKMPHLLVAGATGSGKSVCINGLIMSVLFKAKPHEVKLMMIDPKMVELNVYNGIPHLLAPVVTDPRRASVALKKVVAEMERRYQLFAKTGSRNIEMYNQQLKAREEQGAGSAILPYIVVIVDELADLMMVAPGEVEDAICRLAQMARAAGIHLIIATQRPSVDVITGVIKANIPSRIAFGVSSMADSRTILDMAGAEKLLGRGDMLYLPMGASKPTRIQGAFVSDREVEEVVRFVKEQQEAMYQEEMMPEEPADEAQMEAEDELYDQAVLIVAEAQTASASLLQRRLRIGYTRAARLIDMMEARGVVGPYEGSKPREVRVPKPSSESHIS